MRKLSILLVLAILTTIGGVYATWNYAEGKVSQVVDDTRTTVNITLANTETPAGTIKIHPALSLTIDDEGGKNGVPQYTPGWDDFTTPEAGGSLDLEFEASAMAGATHAHFKYTIAVENNKYTDTAADGTTTSEVNIFNFTPVAGEATNVFMSGEFNWERDNPADPSNPNEAHVIITYQQFIAALQVNGDFQLETLDQYNTYAAAVKNVKIVVTVTDITENY